MPTDKTITKASVYLESSFISYLTARPSRNTLQAARQRITREWWAKRKPLFDCFVSDAVIAEIGIGEPAMASKRLSTAQGLPRIPASERAEALAKALLARRALPPNAAQDALHIALATAAGLDFMLTWNCTHLANAQIEAKVIEVCQTVGYACPVICTPEQLMGD